jgi:glycine cleavage system H protein
VKAASDVYAPVAGTVVAVNEKLVDAPELINEDPYGDGWMFRLQIADPSQLDSLLDASAYEVVESED